MELIDGAIAEAGGDLTVVSDLEVLLVVLFDVESVTIGWACKIDEAITKKTPTAIFFIWVLFKVKTYYYL